MHWSEPNLVPLYLSSKPSNRYESSVYLLTYLCIEIFRPDKHVGEVNNSGEFVLLLCRFPSKQNLIDRTEPDFVSERAACCSGVIYEQSGSEAGSDDSIRLNL